MKSNKSIIWAVILVIVVAAFFRAIPGRPWGFIPHLSLALFGGAIIKDKKWAFALPIFSIFLSDVLYQILYTSGIFSIKGFYQGQWFMYLLYAGIVLLGFTMKKVNVVNVFVYSVAAPTLFFLVSNFQYWLMGGADIRTQLPLSRDFTGLIQSYAQALPFYPGSLAGTLVFSTILFGGYYLLKPPVPLKGELNQKVHN